MKKYIKLAIAAGMIVIFIIMILPKLTQTATQYKEPSIMIQTWEEFLESGVRIKYDDAPTTVDYTDFKTTDHATNQQRNRQ